MWWDTLLVGMQIDTVILEICLEAVSKAKNRTTVWLNYSTPPKNQSYCIVEDTCIPMYAMTLFTVAGMDSV